MKIALTGSFLRQKMREYQNLKDEIEDLSQELVALYFIEK
jgi:hypothetical protein